VDPFQDNDVDEARRHGGVVQLGGARRLLLPRVFGFCGGVVHALTQLRRSVGNAGGRPVRLLGPVIHNDTVNDYFRAQGVTIVAEGDVPAFVSSGDPGNMVVIPAFGVPLEVEAVLRQRYAPERIVDTTCRDVRAVWEFMESLAGEGWTILVHGKADHPETRATLSRALRRATRVAVVPTLAHLASVCRAVGENAWELYPRELVQERGKAPAAGPVACVHQTTMLHDETMAFEAAVRDACGRAGRTCRLADTVCRATQDRQNAAVEICGQHPDLVLVVGGLGSSNTAQLYRLASASVRAYLVRNAGDLEPGRIRHWVPGDGAAGAQPWLPPGWTTIGILAGASCPATDVGNVIRWFRHLAAEPAAGGAAEGG
jgi:4-hydroxy-3-methylbut-2-en-1-yl diphosphate reductase